MPHILLGVDVNKRSEAFIEKENAFMMASMIVESEDRAKAAKKQKAKGRRNI